MSGNSINNSIVDWEYLEAGPEDWRVRISRVAPPAVAPDREVAGQDGTGRDQSRKPLDTPGMGDGLSDRPQVPVEGKDGFLQGCQQPKCLKSGLTDSPTDV